MNHDIKNVPVQGSSEDSGWFIHATGRCWTTWHREIKTERDPAEVCKELVSAKDYPGWTGVDWSRYHSKNGTLVVWSTWDSCF